MEIGIIGLGKMGANIASNLHDQGYAVRGMDTSKAVCEAIQAKRIPTFEKGLHEAILKGGDHDAR